MGIVHGDFRIFYLEKDWTIDNQSSAVLFFPYANSAQTKRYTQYESIRNSDIFALGVLFLNFKKHLAEALGVFLILS